VGRPAAAFAASPVNFRVAGEERVDQMTAAPSSMRKAEWPSQIRSWRGGPIQSGGEESTTHPQSIHEIYIDEVMD
jgi:hypothetical protein